MVSGGGLLFSILGTVSHFSQVGVAGVGLRSVPHVFAVGMFAYMLLSNHVGETTIPLSTVDTIKLDEEAGILVVQKLRLAVSMHTAYPILFNMNLLGVV